MPGRVHPRPPWWPENEPWPPHRGFRGHGPPPARFFRRVALAAAALIALAFSGLFALGWLAAGAFGAAGTAWGLAVALAAAILVSIAVMGVLAGSFRRVRRPLQAVMEAADRVAGGDYSTRLAEQGPPPLRQLARAFNVMTSRLRDHDRQRRDLMADIAHELRTPLTIVRGRVEGLLDGVYPWTGEQLRLVLEETDVLSRLIEDLRTLALSESGALRLEREPTDIGSLARDAGRAFASEARERGVTLDVDVADGLEPIAIDAVRMRQAVGNLLSNALRHTPRGASVTVAVSRGPASGALVEVRDTGPGMSADELARVFDRFQKGAGSGGSGLGLTIARNLVAAHGGEIRASSAEGRGTAFTIVIPGGT